MQKRIFVFLTLLFVLIGVVSSVYAATPVKVSVVGENASNTAEIESLKIQVLRLESALSAREPQAAAETWANAVKLRNGALQYALMSPELREHNYQQLKENSWSTGTSSPWIESFTVSEREKANEGTYIYDIAYTFTDSTRATFITSESIVINKAGDNWVVALVEKTPDIRGKISELAEKGGTTRIFVEGNANISSYDKAYVAITEETKIYKGWTNELLSVDELQEGVTVEVTFSGPALMSYPIQVGAGTIRIL